MKYSTLFLFILFGGYLNSQSYAEAVETVLENYTENYKYADSIYLDELAYIYEYNIAFSFVNLHYFYTHIDTIKANQALRCLEPSCQLYFYSVKDKLDFKIKHYQQMNLPSIIRFSNRKEYSSKPLHHPLKRSYIIISPLINSDEENYEIWIQNLKSDNEYAVIYSLQRKNRNWVITNTLEYNTTYLKADKNYIRLMR